MARTRHGEFTDDHRVVLMMLRERNPRLAWSRVAEIFNIVFHNDHNEAPRTEKTLQQNMTHRKGAQKAVWDLAAADVTSRNRWTPAIAAAESELANPNRTPITPMSEPNLNWDYERRLGSHILMESKTLSLQRRVKIFNIIFRAFIADQKAKPLSKTAFQGQYLKEKRRAEKVAGVGPQKPPAKSKKYVMKKPTSAQDWQRILQVPQTEQDLAKRAELKAEIDKARKTLGWVSEEEVEESDEKMSEEEASEDEWEDGPFDEEEPIAYDPSENVGRWAFVNDVEDGYQATVNLGQQRPGMPARPGAEDIQRFREQHRRAGRSERMTDGINIVRVPNQAANQSAAQSAIQSDAQSASDSAAQSVIQPTNATTQPDSQPAAPVAGHWRFRTDADQAKAISNFGPDITAWQVRQRSLRELAACHTGGIAASIDVHYVRNTDSSQPSDPHYDFSPESLMIMYKAMVMRTIRR